MHVKSKKQRKDSNPFFRCITGLIKQVQHINFRIKYVFLMKRNTLQPRTLFSRFSCHFSIPDKMIYVHTFVQQSGFTFRIRCYEILYFHATNKLSTTLQFKFNCYLLLYPAYSSALRLIHFVKLYSIKQLKCWQQPDICAILERQREIRVGDKNGNENGIEMNVQI